jgi:CRISPR-associated protein Cmr1
MKKSIVFSCETITPLFMFGADGTTPELRAPSIKGLLRFWWRSLHGHLNIDMLKATESAIFGSTQEKSGFSIRIAMRQPIQTLHHILLPHRINSFKAEAIRPRQQFTVIFTCKDAKIGWLIQHLFPLSCVLGGFGKRSRRGFGSIRILGEHYPTRLVEIQAYLEAIVPKKYILIENEIAHLATFRPLFPCIEKIEIGRADFQLLRTIGDTSHQVKQAVGDYEYSQALGSAQPRRASPVVVSAIETYRGLQSLVVTLYSVQQNLSINRIQNQFKENILK